MDVSNFFNRLLQPPKPVDRATKPLDDLEEFDTAWKAMQETLEQPDERQILRGIQTTNVPADLRHLVDALVYESNRTDEDETGPCFEYFLKNDLLSILERLAEANRPHGIKGEVLRAINNLIVLLSDRFLIHNAVHRPLRRLLRSCVGDEPRDDTSKRLFGAASLHDGLRRGDADFDADLVDLMCILCSKMRAHPALLLIFFHDKGWLQSHPSSGAPSSLHLTPNRTFSPTPTTRTNRSDTSRPSLSGAASTSGKPSQRFEFLLFSYLLRFVHRDGRTGDFARAGLLFLFDIAFLTVNEEGGENLHLPPNKDGSDPLQDARDALGEYILDGDFAEVMAAAAGAVYSLLPSKVRAPYLAEQGQADETAEGVNVGAGVGSGGMQLDPDTIADALDGRDDLPSTLDGEVRGQLDLLVKLFGFLQDIIHRCLSPLANLPPGSSANETDDIPLIQAMGMAIADSTLDAMQTSFLDNVLYPSIMECSPTDGSSVAVMTYIDVLLNNLDDGPLLTRLLEDLLDLETANAPASEGARRQPRSGSDRFTLKDLILDNAQSAHPQAATAAMRLYGTLFTEHCGVATQGLVSTVSKSNQLLKTLPVVGQDEAEMYGDLITRIDPNSDYQQSAGFSAYVADACTAIRNDRCFILADINEVLLAEDEKAAIRSARKGTCQHHSIAPVDSITRTMLGKLGRYLLNSPDENVALTGAFLALGICSRRSLAGLFTSESAEDRVPWAEANEGARDDNEESDSKSDDSSDDFFDSPVLNRGSHGTHSVRSTPAIFQIVLRVVQEINRQKGLIPSFDRLLAERRRGLLFADHLDEAMSAMLEQECDAFGPTGNGTGTMMPSSTGTTPTGKLPVTPTTINRGTQPTTPLPKRARPSLAGSIKSFFSPGRKVQTSPRSGTPQSIGTPREQSISVSTAEQHGEARVGRGADGPTPFKDHYEATQILVGLSLTTAVNSSPRSTSTTEAAGTWMDADLSSVDSAHGDTVSTAEEHPRAIAVAGEEGCPDAGSGSAQVTLSRMLDNVVILEEFLKELAALIIARRVNSSAQI